MKEYGLQISLLFLAVVLGVWVFSEKAAEEVQRQRTGLMPQALRLDQIAEIALKNVKGGFSLSPAVEGSHWQVNAEEELRVTSRFVARLIELLVKAGENATSVEEEENQDSYGLTEPLAEFTVVSKNGNRWSLQLGALNDYTGGRYIKASDAGVYITPDTMEMFTDITPEDLVTRTPFQFDPEQAIAVEFESGGSRSEFKRVAGAEWKLSSASAAVVNSVLIKSFFTALQKPPVLNTIIDQENVTKLRSIDGRMNIAITTEEGQVTFSLYRYHASGTLFLILLPEENSTLAYALKPEPLLLGAFDPDRTFVNRRAFQLMPDKITAVSIQRTGETTLSIQKEDGDWKVGQQDGDPPFIEEYLRRLSGVQCFSVHQPESGQSELVASIAVTHEDNSGASTLLNAQVRRVVAEGREGGYLLESAEIPFHCQLSKKQTQRLLPSAEVLLPAAILE